MNTPIAWSPTHDPMKDDYKTQWRLSRRLHRRLFLPGVLLVVIAVLTLAAGILGPPLSGGVLVLYAIVVFVVGAELIDQAYDEALEFINDHSLEQRGDEIVIRTVR